MQISTAQRALPAVLASLAVVHGLAACGDTAATTDTTDASTQAEAVPCTRAPRPLVAALKSSLTISGGGSLENVTVLRVDDAPSAPITAFDRGAYVAAAKLTGPGMGDTIATWAISRDMAKTGGGFAVGADSVTREFSEAGAAAEVGSPIADYAAEIAESDAGQRARACASD